MMLGMACVFVRVLCSSIHREMGVDHGEVRCCGMSKVWNGGDGWNLSGDVVCHAQIC
jgi:hypothetical protein